MTNVGGLSEYVDHENNGYLVSPNVEEIADALHDASDHLPVYMDVWFDDLTYSDQEVVITEVMVNPSSVSDSYGEWFEIVNMADTTIDIQGWTIMDSDGDEELSFSDFFSSLLPYFIYGELKEKPTKKNI